MKDGQYRDEVDAKVQGLVDGQCRMGYLSTRLGGRLVQGVRALKEGQSRDEVTEFEAGRMVSPEIGCQSLKHERRSVNI